MDKVVLRPYQSRWVAWFVSFFLLILLYRLFFAWSVAKRLRSMAQSMDEISKEPQIYRYLDVTAKGDVGRIARAFARVVGALNGAQNSLNAGIQELAEEENRFRSLTQSASDAIISVDGQGVVVTWNHGAERLFGYTEVEMLGQPVLRLVPEPLRAAHIRGFTAAASSHIKLSGRIMETKGVHKAGHSIPVEIGLSTWGIGGMRHFSAIIRDIKERYGAREKNHRDRMSRMAINAILGLALRPLPLTEKLGRCLQVTLAVPWLSLQYRGAIFLLNPKTEKLDLVVEHGLGAEILTKCQSISLGSCLCGRSAAQKKFIFVDNLDDRHEISYEDMAPHGHYCVPILLGERLLGVMNLYLEAGHQEDVEEVRFLEMVAHTLASIIDRKYAERNLRQLSQALEQSPVSVMITDLAGIIEYVNPKCCQVTEYDALALIGRNPKILKSGMHPEVVYRELWATLTRGDVWRGELYNRKRGGQLYWEDATISPIRNERGVVIHYLAVKEDITQRKHLEESLRNLLDTLDSRVAERTEELNGKVLELERTRNELVESEKMASLGRLVAGFAHEINTPIGVAVAGSSQVGEALREMELLLKEDEVEEAQLTSVLATMREATALAMNNLRRAGDLISSFKRTSVDQTSEVVRLFAVREAIEDVVKSLSNQLRKKQVVVVVHCAMDLRLYGIPGILDQILTNLIVNSMLHGFAEGHSHAGNIVIQVDRDGERLILNYSDDGLGMAEDVRQKIFEPFFTTRRAFGGNGLGLYLCYNLVTSKLNGTITCESSPGAGVRFTIIFPVWERDL